MRNRRLYGVVAAISLFLPLTLWHGFFRPSERVAFVPLQSTKLKLWRCEAKMTWTGAKWTLRECFEPQPATIADTPHLVLEKSNGLFELQHFQAAQSDGSMQRFFVVYGDQLEFFASDHKLPGCFHLDVLVKGRWNQFWTMQSIGGWTLIPCPTNMEVPQASLQNSVYRISNGKYQFVRAIRTEADLWADLETGDYYLSPPGTDLQQIIDIKTVQ
jgi:hypothetical protein